MAVLADSNPIGSVLAELPVSPVVGAANTATP